MKSKKCSGSAWWYSICNYIAELRSISVFHINKHVFTYFTFFSSTEKWCLLYSDCRLLQNVWDGLRVLILVGSENTSHFPPALLSSAPHTLPCLKCLLFVWYLVYDAWDVGRVLPCAPIARLRTLLMSLNSTPPSICWQVCLFPARRHI